MYGKGKGRKSRGRETHLKSNQNQSSLACCILPAGVESWFSELVQNSLQERDSESVRASLVTCLDVSKVTKNWVILHIFMGVRLVKADPLLEADYSFAQW